MSEIAWFHQLPGRFDPAGCDLRILDDLSRTFRERILPTSPRTLADGCVVSSCKFYLVKHLSSFADQLPFDVCRNGDNQRPRLFPAADCEIRRTLKFAFHRLGEPLGQSIVPNMPELNKRGLGRRSLRVLTCLDVFENGSEWLLISHSAERGLKRG